MNPNLTALGNFVRPRRARLGLSLGAMAKAMGMSSASLSQYEVHKEPFPEHWAEPIAEFLELSAQEKEQLQGVRLSSILAKKDSGDRLKSDLFIERFLSSKHQLSDSDIIKLEHYLDELIDNPTHREKKSA